MSSVCYVCRMGKMTFPGLAKMILQSQNRAMNRAEYGSPRNLSMLLSLWGVDVAVATLCWGLLVVEHLRITMLTVGPLLVLVSAVWLVVMLRRLVASARREQVSGEAAYYRSRVVPLLPLWVAVLCAALWMLFFRVGQSLLYFGMLPVCFLALGMFPILGRLRIYVAWCCAAAFVFVCAAPAYYYSFSLTPFHMLDSTPLWLMSAVFGLFFAERWSMGRAEGIPIVLQVLCHLALFVCCVYWAVREPAYMRGFYVSLSMAVAALHVLCRLRPRVAEEAWSSLGWSLMALPALLGLLVGFGF